MNDDWNLRPRTKIIAFCLMAGLTALSWVVFKLIWKRPAYEPDDYISLAETDFSPSLPARYQEILDAIRQGRTYTPAELNSYNVYVLDTSRGSSTELYTVVYEPNIPYDRTYQDFRIRYDQQTAQAEAEKNDDIAL